MTEDSDASGSLVQIETFNRTENNDDKNTGATDFEFDFYATSAIRAINDDFGRQLDLASDRQNTMVQSVGIIMAFASILLIEVVRLLYLEPDSANNIIALIVFLLCCAVGVATIWQWKNWELYSGFNFNDILFSFNEKRFADMHLFLLKGMIDSHKILRHNNYIVKERISLMMIFLSVGIALMLVGLVIEWV